MKKFLLLILTITLFGSANSFAQSFTRYKDTVWTNWSGGSMNIHNDITPLDTTSAGVTLKWKVIACNFPADWLAVNPGMCDNSTCYQFNGASGCWPAGSLWTSNPYTVSGTHDFHLMIDLSAATTKGLYYCTVKLYNASNPSDSLYSTFAVSNYPAAVPAVAKSKEILLYPNPTTSEINVVYDAADDIKTISVYSIIGKAMAIYKPITDNSAYLSLENVPAGIYFLRLINSKGEVVNTKKFTKQ